MTGLFVLTCLLVLEKRGFFKLLLYELIIEVEVVTTLPISAAVCYLFSKKSRIYTYVYLVLDIG